QAPDLRRTHKRPRRPPGRRQPTPAKLTIVVLSSSTLSPGKTQFATGNSGDVVVECGSVKAATAHEARTAIIAHGAVSRNRRSQPLDRRFGLAFGGAAHRLRLRDRGKLVALDCRPRDLGNGWSLTGAAVHPERALGRRRRHFRNRAVVEEFSRHIRLRGCDPDRRRRGQALAQGRFQLTVIGAGDRRAADILDLHLRQSVAVEAEQLGGAHRKVDQAVADIGPAIVDAHDNRPVILEIGHAHIRRQRQSRMRRRDGVHVEDFAIGGVAAVKIVAIPGGKASGGVIHVFLRNVSAAADDVRMADPIDAAAFRHRLAGGNYAFAAGNAITGIDAARTIAIGAIGESKTAGSEHSNARRPAEPGISPKTPHTAGVPYYLTAEYRDFAATGMVKAVAW